MNFISLLLKICLPWEPPPGALRIHPTRPRVKNSSFIPYRRGGSRGLPSPSPPPCPRLSSDAWLLQSWWHQDAGLWGLWLRMETKHSIGVFLATSYYKGCWSKCTCEHRHTGTYTGKHTRWACMQGHTFKYSQLGSGPLRAKGTESLVLGTQLLVVLGRAMAPGPGEMWEWGDIGKCSQRWGLRWE